MLSFLTLIPLLSIPPSAVAPCSSPPVISETPRSSGAHRIFVQASDDVRLSIERTLIRAGEVATLTEEEGALVLVAHSSFRKCVDPRTQTPVTVLECTLELRDPASAKLLFVTEVIKARSELRRSADRMADCRERIGRRLELELGSLLSSVSTEIKPSETGTSPIQGRNAQKMR